MVKGQEEGKGLCAKWKETFLVKMELWYILILVIPT